MKPRKPAARPNVGYELLKRGRCGLVAEARTLLRE